MVRQVPRLGRNGVLPLPTEVVGGLQPAAKEPWNPSGTDCATRATEAVTRRYPAQRLAVLDIDFDEILTVAVRG